ncbi:hypothetical protein E1B28_004434 [Marasmius oreades]|uniref:Uncharacterized protein n=1 Tax=Marasmius oreades TaxID=181124 RepID=A0A9P7UYM0_9AGAR|nr:uncharacterized protein E1B28_004434 [Marasmius oreades]KAG7097043.1 hypothetical protein E1B28_004434 [Marasmius oreades]
MSDTPSAPIANQTGGNPNAPQEPPELFVLEHYDFAGIQLSEILYGITIVLFFRCMLALLRPRNGRKPSYLLALYTFVLFGLGTIFTALNGRLLQLSFIDNRAFEGGPEAYWLSIYSTSMPLTANTVFIIANWLADGLLLFRCKVVWQEKYWILAFPVLLAFGDLAMGSLYLYQLSQPNANLFTKQAVDFGLPYFVLSTSLNVLLTILLCSRLIFHQRWIAKTLLRTQVPYMSIVAMLIESSAIYAACSIIFIGTYGAGNIASSIFLPVLAQTQVGLSTLYTCVVFFLDSIQFRF